jgi:hypothetical protein
MYRLSYRSLPTHLHVVVTGENTVQDVVQYIDEMQREAVARGAKRILIEDRLIGPPLSVFAVFDIVSAASVRIAGLFEAIAFVELHGSGDMAQFIENVAVNRSIPLAVFRTVEDAEQWITSPDPSVKPRL